MAQAKWSCHLTQNSRVATTLEAAESHVFYRNAVPTRSPRLPLGGYLGLRGIMKRTQPHRGCVGILATPTQGSRRAATLGSMSEPRCGCRLEHLVPNYLGCDFSLKNNHQSLKV